MKDFLKWVVTSSSDPKKWSLLVIGIAGQAGAQILRLSDTACGLGFYCTGIDIDFVNSIVEGLGHVAYAAAFIISLIAMFVGALRKIKLGKWAAQEAL